MALFSYFRKRRTQGTLNEELQFHLLKEVELNLARGMPAEEARRQALIAFGGVQQTRENVRVTRWTQVFEVFLQDLRYGGRMLRKTPVFTGACVAILALGIGMNSAIFSLLEAVLFRALPASRPAELVLLRWRAHKPPAPHGESIYGDCEDLPAEGCSFSSAWLDQIRAQTSIFSAVAAFAGAPRLDVSVRSAEPVAIVENAQFVSGEFFPALGTRASLGRLLTPADDGPAAAPVVVLSNSYWQRVLNADPSAVGRTIHINDTAFVVIGVAEARFSGLTPGSQIDLWMPLSAKTRLYPESASIDTNSTNWWLVIVGRLRQPGSIPKAEAALSLLYRNQVLHAERHLFDDSDNPEIELVSAQKGLDGSRPNALKPLYVLMLGVGLVLLIACANIAGLLLARSATREREIAVRMALGARPGRLVRQMLTESLLLALLGGGAGIAIAIWGARLVRAMSVAPIADFAPHLDARVLAFTATATLLTGILFGLLPSLRSLRFDVLSALKIGTGAGRPRRSWMNPGNLLVSFRSHWLW